MIGGVHPYRFPDAVRPLGAVRTSCTPSRRPPAAGLRAALARRPRPSGLARLALVERKWTCPRPVYGDQYAGAVLDPRRRKLLHGTLMLSLVLFPLLGGIGSEAHAAASPSSAGSATPFVRPGAKGSAGADPAGPEQPLQDMPNHESAPTRPRPAAAS
jgi:hypothetical protein